MEWWSWTARKGDTLRVQITPYIYIKLCCEAGPTSVAGLPAVDVTV